MTDYPQDIVKTADEVCRAMDIASTTTNCLPIMAALMAERGNKPLFSPYEALQPFANVYQHDIGSDEADGDLFQVINNNRAPKLTVEDFRRAYNACWERSP